ncbi:MAG: DUF3592 domain-containing protein [Deltaproteobacteria bacterium]|nr:DUF3592 domain-containing protein [Deltaproteobacteria bacterium]
MDQKMSPGMRFFFGRLFPLPFFIAGAVILFFGLRDLNRAMESASWPTAKGVIERSSVEYHSDSDGSTYSAEIVYDFIINRVTYSGDSVGFGDLSTSSVARAQNIVNRYPKEASVTVHYMPGRPEVCVLEPGVKGQTLFMPIFGLVFFVTGAAMLIYMPRLMKSQADRE